MSADAQGLIKLRPKRTNAQTETSSNDDDVISPQLSQLLDQLRDEGLMRGGERADPHAMHICVDRLQSHLGGGLNQQTRDQKEADGISPASSHQDIVASAKHRRHYFAASLTSRL